MATEDTAQEPVLIERLNVGYLTHWMCEPPLWGAPFKVTRDSWSEDGSIRYIHEAGIIAYTPDWSDPTTMVRYD